MWTKQHVTSWQSGKKQEEAEEEKEEEEEHLNLQFMSFL